MPFAYGICRLALLTGLVVVLAACSKPELSARGAKLRVVQQPMGQGCAEVGRVQGESGGTGGVYMSDEKLIEHAYNDMLNQAAEMDATHVYPQKPELAELDGVTHRGIVKAIAYRCGQRKRPAEPEVARRLRTALDARARDILACVGADRVAVRLDYTPDEPFRIALQGDLEGSPEQACVVAVLGELDIDTGEARGAVIHVVRPETDAGQPRR